MPYTKRPAGGTKVEYSATLGWDGPWTVLPGVTGDITLPGGTPSEVDITTHDDVIAYGGWRQKGAGLADTQNPSFDLLLDPDDTTHIAMLTALQNRTVLEFQFTMPGVTKKYGVKGQVGMTKRAPINGYLTSTVTILANQVTFDVAASALLFVAREAELAAADAAAQAAAQAASTPPA